MKAMPPRTIHESFLSRLLNDDEFQQGKLCRRAHMAVGELIEREQADYKDIEEQIASVVELLESPIEQVAAFHLLGRNYAPFTTQQSSYAMIYSSLPEEWPRGLLLAIVPQVDIGRYRVDFMVHLRNGMRFAIECDGDEFHDEIKDGVRDATLMRHFSLLVLRFTGAQIWESPLWTNEVRKTIFMLLGMRNAEVTKR